LVHGWVGSWGVVLRRWCGVVAVDIQLVERCSCDAFEDVVFACWHEILVLVMRRLMKDGWGKEPQRTLVGRGTAKMSWILRVEAGNG
jgi:hypothetical protein